MCLDFDGANYFRPLLSWSNCMDAKSFPRFFICCFFLMAIKSLSSWSMQFFVSAWLDIIADVLGNVSISLKQSRTVFWNAWSFGNWARPEMINTLNKLHFILSFEYDISIDVYLFAKRLCPFETSHVHHSSLVFTNDSQNSKDGANGKPFERTILSMCSLFVKNINENFTDLDLLFMWN